MYKFVINDFEGPMDLLLHLVHQADIDIYDINLVDLVNQYLDFISEMEKLELNVASEYIVMAAELIELKSKSLLPQSQEKAEDEIEPREELINRLIEYKRYKEITSSFKTLEEERKKYFSKDPSSLKDFIVKREEKGDISLLLDAFNEFMLKKKDENIVTKTTTKEDSIIERSEEIKNIVKLKKKVEFKELFDNLSKDYIIITFLALLEMVKKEEINIIQECNFSNIYVTGGVK